MIGNCQGISLRALYMLQQELNPQRMAVKQMLHCDVFLCNIQLQGLVLSSTLLFAASTSSFSPYFCKGQKDISGSSKEKLGKLLFLQFLLVLSVILSDSRNANISLYLFRHLLSLLIQFGYDKSFLVYAIIVGKFRLMLKLLLPIGSDQDDFAFASSLLYSFCCLFLRLIF